MASGGACTYVSLLSLTTYLAPRIRSRTYACVVCDGSSLHWLYEPIAKPRVQLAKLFLQPTVKSVALLSASIWCKFEYHLHCMCMCLLTRVYSIKTAHIRQPLSSYCVGALNASLFMFYVLQLSPNSIRIYF